MASTGDIRNGLTINWNNGIYTIVEFLHVKPGKGPAFVRTKLKNLATGRVLDNTFPSGHKIDVVRVERREYQFLYRDGDSFNFMNNENFEQIPIGIEHIPNSQFLKEGMICTILTNTEDDSILSVDMPDKVEMVITYTEPGIRGDTATNTLKPATVESGAEVRVPLFVDIGDKIRINTSTGEYVERVK